MHSTPASLLDQIRQSPGDEAWSRLVHLYTPLLYHWASRLGLQPADCADLLQDIFIALLRGLPNFVQQRPGSFRAWLRTISLHKWSDKQRKKIAATLGAEDDLLDNLAADDSAIEFEEEEYRSYVVHRAALLIEADFQPATWQAFWATTVESRPVNEVAAELGIAPNTIYVARSRILKRLRTELAGLLE
jgi:RNA polymerase sigma-70 factor (ECF subfamily)